MHALTMFINYLNTSINYYHYNNEENQKTLQAITTAFLFIINDLFY